MTTFKFKSALTRQLFEEVCGTCEYDHRLLLGIVAIAIVNAGILFLGLMLTK